MDGAASARPRRVGGHGSSAGRGLVLDWQQASGQLIATGPVDTIRVWDVSREVCISDLPVEGSGLGVSSVCSAAEGSVVFAGGGDGVVRMYDLRADCHAVHIVSRHPTPIVSVNVQRGASGFSGSSIESALLASSLGVEGHVLSGSAGGDIHITDRRMLGGLLEAGTSGVDAPGTFSVIPAFDKSIPLDTLVVHNHAPLFAAGSRKQLVRIAAFRTQLSVPVLQHAVSTPALMFAVVCYIWRSSTRHARTRVCQQRDVTLRDVERRRGPVDGLAAPARVLVDPGGVAVVAAGAGQRSAAGAAAALDRVDAASGRLHGRAGHRQHAQVPQGLHGPPHRPRRRAGFPSVSRCRCRCRPRALLDALSLTCVCMCVCSHKLQLAIGGAGTPLVSVMAAFPPAAAL